MSPSDSAYRGLVSWLELENFLSCCVSENLYVLQPWVVKLRESEQLTCYFWYTYMPAARDKLQDCPVKKHKGNPRP